jgi:hypothetical protein
MCGLVGDDNDLLETQGVDDVPPDPILARRATDEA